MNTVNNLPKTITDVTLLDFTGAKRSYSGKAGRCCCGCSGNYSESKASVTRQINKIKKLVAAGYKAEVGSNNIAVEVLAEGYISSNPGRLYIVYFE